MTGTIPPPDLHTLDEVWDDLLEYIEDRRVIPILGPSLVQVATPQGPAPLLEVVAEQLAARLRLDPGHLPTPFGLNDVVREHLAQRGRREDVYPKIRGILKELPLEPGPALRKLARIRDFDLFVTLTWDGLMAEALNLERFGGEARTQVFSYAPNAVQDLPRPRDQFREPIVYSLVGKVSAQPDYVITEEDLLEFVTALASESRRPTLLFDELQGNHLLFLGTGLADWLARFFVRTAKNRQLSQQRGELELVVDPAVSESPSLISFFSQFSYGTRVFAATPEAFIDELLARWEQRHPATSAPAHAAPAPAAEEAPGMAPGAVFISYAKEDLEAVQHLARALEEGGIEVWFDKDRLEAGDLYDLKIRKHIRACSYFLPVISRNAERRLEGYFRKEWNLAVDRCLSLADHLPFLLPVVIDDTPEYAEFVPERFGRVQWTRLPEGQCTPEFTARLVQLVRDFRRRERGLG